MSLWCVDKLVTADGIADGGACEVTVIVEMQVMRRPGSGPGRRFD
ncbi:MAG: hypothetical protein P1U83_02530 [Roseovarius sp.]|nr:hypothetical protein [Roseovarius sp.]